MRTLRLARIAATAEGLRLRYAARRAAFRAIFLLVALVFLTSAVILLHVAAWSWLRPHLEAAATAAILAGADLVLALLFALLATSSSPGRLEREALAVRQRALDTATRPTGLASLTVQLLRLAIDLFGRSRR